VPAPLTGRVLLPDGSPAAGARITLEAEVDQQIAGGTRTDGFLVGTDVTDASGHWRIVPTWPGTSASPVKNPDGSIMIDAQATSADGRWAKLFNFNMIEPTDPSGSAVVPEVFDSGIVSRAPRGQVASVNLSFSGVTESASDTPGSSKPVAKASKKTCDELHHVCFITGDPGPCRSRELVSSWRNMVGDAHTKKRKRGWELLVGLDVGTSDYPLIEGVEVRYSTGREVFRQVFRGSVIFCADDTAPIAKHCHPPVALERLVGYE
jgi:hypothetical protein